MNFSKHFILFSIFCNNVFCQSSQTLTSSIAHQLGFGVKRVSFYFDSHLEKCNDVGDLNSWILLMNDYLMCSEETSSENLKGLNLISSHERIKELCRAWPRRRECSSRLASKLDSCLGPSLEDGSAGTNGLGLADAHMNFICRHRHEYISVLQKSEEPVAVERRAWFCYEEIKDRLDECVNSAGVNEMERTFCQKFELASLCLLRTSEEMCSHQLAKDFVRTMLGQLAFELNCGDNSANEIE